MKRGSSLRSIRPWPTGFSSLFSNTRRRAVLDGRHDGLPAVRSRRLGLRTSAPALPSASSRLVAPSASVPAAVRGPRPTGSSGRWWRSRCSGRSGPRSPRGSRARRRVGVAVEQRAGGHHHPRGAEPALQPVALHEPLLDGVELGALLEVLDGAHLAAAGHRGEHRARLHRLAVHPDHARAAVAGVAAPVGPGEAEVVPQVVHEQQPALDLAGDLVAVDGHRHLHGQLSSPLMRATDRRRARRVSSSARCRLYSTVPASVLRRAAALGRDRAGPGVQLLGRLLPAQRLRDRVDARGVRADRGQPDPRVGDDAAVHPDRGAGRARPPSRRRGARPSRRRWSRPAGSAGAPRSASRRRRPRSRTGRGGTPAIVTTRSPGCAADDAARAERGADGRQVLGRVGLAQRAAEGAAVAHDGVGDDALGVADDREVPRRARRTRAARGAGPSPRCAPGRARP